MKTDTSWNAVAEWYDTLLEEKPGTYQKELILPNVLRLLGVKKGDTVLDLACGQGLFSRAFANAGAQVIGVDASKRLIDFAKKHSPQSIQYHIRMAHRLAFVKDHTIDSVVIVLAIQNIENIADVFAECRRVLKPRGRLLMVLNHPAFRIPKASDWEHDTKSGVIYRRVAQYLSESTIAIDMHPGAGTGAKKSEQTITFHRPLQVYSKALAKAGFAIARLEEWNSHKTSQPGPRQKAENTSRKEIPLFLCIEARQI
jgi:ubiquinone/menaquinone biosynthesis C-methylase UbiE